jgi:hypothetical protein
MHLHESMFFFTFDGFVEIKPKLVAAIIIYPFILYGNFMWIESLHL